MSHFGTWTLQRRRAPWLKSLTAPMTDLEAFLTFRLLSVVGTLPASG